MRRSVQTSPLPSQPVAGGNSQVTTTAEPVGFFQAKRWSFPAQTKQDSGSLPPVRDLLLLVFFLATTWLHMGEEPAQGDSLPHPVLQSQKFNLLQPLLSSLQIQLAVSCGAEGGLVALHLLRR